MAAAARKRIQRELAAGSSTPELITSRASGEDLLTLHYVLRGPKDTPFEGGFFHGLLKFPDDYPLKPPGIIMLTPSGRFECGMRLCLSMSDYHVSPFFSLLAWTSAQAPLSHAPSFSSPPARALAAHMEPRQDFAWPAELYGGGGAQHGHHCDH